MSTNQNEGATKAAVALTGIYQVSAFFDPKDVLATLAKTLLQPDGNHYVKLTDAGSGITKIEFSDASGNTSGFNAGNPDATPPYYGDFSAIVNATNPVATKHYWKNNMPLALAFQDVTFTFDSATGNITNGNGVHAIGRRNGNPNSSVPSFINPDQNSDNTASIITTTGNSASAFAIRVKLGFQVNFEVLLTKI